MATSTSPSRQAIRDGTDDTLPDDYPIRPRSPGTEEIVQPYTGKSHIRTIILISFVFFVYGLGTGFYGPLYPRQEAKRPSDREAYQSGLDSRMYGAVIATRYFMCILAYPLACRMVTSVSKRLFFSVSIFTIGTCHVLFGTLSYVENYVAFVSISFAVQAVEGIGMSILLVTTLLISYSGQQLLQNLSLSIQFSLGLGLVVSPIVGKVLDDLIGFDKTFYVIGCLMVLIFIFTAIFLPEPDQQVAYEDIPVFIWLKDKRQILYFLISTGTFFYTGFVTVCLDHMLWKFHLKSLYIGLVFAILPLTCGLTIPGWALLIKKGFNSVMKIFIGSTLVSSSLLLLGPIPFVHIEANLMTVCVALLLAGLGIACKSACLVQSIREDLRRSNKSTLLQQGLSIPTIFSVGAFFGLFLGSFTSGITDFYLHKKTTLIMFAFEVVIAVTAVVFAFNRNYRSSTQRG